jgi:hypothetical protein
MFGFLNDMFLLKDTSDVSKIYMKKLGNSRWNWSYGFQSLICCSPWRDKRKTFPLIYFFCEQTEYRCNFPICLH